MPVGDLEEGTDIAAVAEKYISMSPLHLDLTDYRSIAKLEEIAAELESRDARSLEQAKP
jgi:broad specificity polyphosphatase/5'/3'-nucleotidase SurE